VSVSDSIEHTVFIIHGDWIVSNWRRRPFNLGVLYLPLPLICRLEPRFGEFAARMLMVPVGQFLKFGKTCEKTGTGGTVVVFSYEFGPDKVSK